MKTKTFLSALAVIAIVLTFIVSAFIPVAGHIGLAMAFIVAGSEYHGKENMDIILRPRFFGTKPQEMGIRVIDSMGASSVKLTFFGKILKVLMPYVTGFQGGASAPQLQKKLVLAEFKAEASYDKHDYANMIMEQIVDRGGISQNDITGTTVMAAEQKIFMDAVEGDVFANFWLGDTAKTHTHAGTYPDTTAYAAGDADKYYNCIDGILKAVITDVYQDYNSKQGLITGWNKTTYPTLYMVDAGGGTTYAYDTSAHRTGAQAGDRLFSYATNTTTGLKALSVLNTSGFGGYINNLKTNASGSWELHANEWDYIKKLALPTLTTDTAATYFNSLFRLASPELKALKASGLLRFYCSDSIIFNYEDTLKAGVLESARSNIVNGVLQYAYNGIPVVPMGIDQLIEADFVSTFPKDWIILSTPENLCLVINGSNTFSETRMWFNPDMNENRQRTQFEMGANYILPELIAAAYA